MTSEIPVAIAVPVRNEADRLPRLLDALARQDGAPPFVLCLFLDNCRDGSEAAVLARSRSLPFPIMTDCCHAGGPPNAGAARRRATDLAVSSRARVFLTTDADSEPALDWVATSLTALAHADIVAGRVVRRRDSTLLQDRLEAYLDRLHFLRRRLDPVAWEDDITHHWTSAASLAMRSETYQALGGFASLANGEDAAFSDAAARAGFRLRRDARVVVHTSSRRRGRATGGFAAGLAALDAADADPTVTHPDDEAWRYEAQREARVRHGSSDLGGLATRLRLPLAEVEQVAGECRNGEAFAARIVGAPPGGLRSVSLAHAEAVLGMAEAPLEGAA